MLGMVLGACSDGPTPTPVGTATANQSVTIAATLLVPQPTPTLTPQPTPTTSPRAFARLAEQAHFNRDDSQAQALFDQASKLLPANDPERGSIQFKLAQIALSNNDLARAGDLFRTISSSATVSPELRTQAAVLLGQMLRDSNDGAGAIAQFSALLTSTQVLSPYLNLWIGEIYLAANQPLSAAVPLQMAVELAPSLSMEFERREKLALAYRTAQQYALAVAQYDAILSRSQVPAYRGRIQTELAGDLINAGQTARALDVLREIVTTTPNVNPGAASSALQMLLNLGVPIDDLQRGMINYEAGNYAAAQQAFRRAIQQDKAPLNEIRYWAGLNYLALNNPLDAFRNFDQNISAGTAAPRYADTLLKKGQSLSDAADVEGSAAAYRQLLQSAPNDPQAFRASFGLGRMYERFQQWPQAEEAFRQTYSNYPIADAAPEALLRASALQVRLGQLTQAISNTQLMQTRYPTHTLTPLAQLWMGKAQLALGDKAGAQRTWQALAQTRPDHFAGARAAELAAGLPPLTAINPVPNMNPADDDGRADAETWLRSWVSPTVSNVQQDVRFVRGAALQQLGYEREALGEFSGLWVDRTRDPAALFALSIHLRDLRLYRLSIATAEALMRLSPTPIPAAMPKFVLRLIYPTYYADLVQQYASEFGHDPRVLYSIIRQESLFEAQAESSAAAQGLMQVVPPTGKEIAGELRWPLNYSTDDLTRPYVSVRFGAYYLSKQKRGFGDDLYAALAAYNGGAGNALKWRERAGDDPDAFYLAVNFEETQRYIRAIALNYGMYQRMGN